jgi:glyoxylase-like metal-dependent hydrolase (beta-lactamase superfamily II)
MVACVFGHYQYAGQERIFVLMNKRTRLALLAVPALLLASAGAAAAVGARMTTHPTEPAAIGAPKSGADLDALVDIPGPLTVDTITGAKWAVPRSGLLNLDDPRAKAAGLTDGPEPMAIFFHAVRHPTRGLYIIDTGVERALKSDPEHAAFRGFVASAMHSETLQVQVDTASWLAAQKEPLTGVFMTHLHVDHITGMRDIPASATVYTGPGEPTFRRVKNFFGQPTADRALEGKSAIQELQFKPDESGMFDGVLDVFGDGSFWAILVPGHTPGSLAFLARTTRGPVLFTGDACHTSWGWNHDVAPGSYTDDRTSTTRSLAHLRAFVAKHPRIDVRLGHQKLTSD